MTSFIAAGGLGRSTSFIPAVPAAWSVTTIAFMGTVSSVIHDRDRARRRHVEPQRMLIGSTGSPAVERKIATTTAKRLFVSRETPHDVGLAIVVALGEANMVDLMREAIGRHTRRSLMLGSMCSYVMDLGDSGSRPATVCPQSLA